MNGVAIDFARVSKTYPGASLPALNGVSLSIRQNEFFTLLGPSGCGKTTLLRMIGGFDYPDSGDVTLSGIKIGRTPPHLRRVNTVFQSYALFPHMTVAQNIGFALEMLNRPRDEVRRRVDEVMGLLRLDGLGDRHADQLSGGQQQRVALGRALAPKPEVLLLDEPLSALDLKLRKAMQVELKRLQAQTGITFVFVTHDQDEALTMSDRIAVMQSGVIRQVGRPDEIYERPADLFVAEFIGDANFLESTCCARSGADGEFQLEGQGDQAPRIKVDKVGHVAVGQKAVLMIRPERVRVVAGAGAALTGRVFETIYSGSSRMVHAKLPNGTLLRARLDGLPVSGALPDEVGFYMDPGALTAFVR